MIIKILQQSKDINRQQTKRKSLKATTHANFIDCIYLTDCPYDSPQLLDDVLDAFEDALGQDLKEIHYTADTEQQRWSIKFRYGGEYSTFSLNDVVDDCYTYDTDTKELVNVEGFNDYKGDDCCEDV